MTVPNREREQVKVWIVKQFDLARQEGLLHSKDGKHSLSSESDAEEILNACYPCKECGGRGKTYVGGHPVDYEIICPTCKGTGQGEKMLAIVAENQELSDGELCKMGGCAFAIFSQSCSYKDDRTICNLYNFGKLLQVRMIARKDGTVWKKVYTEEK